MAKPNSICSVDGCDKPVHAKGCCNTHYYRLRKNGDPLAVKFDRSEEGEHLKFYLQVVLPYDGDECLFWPYNRNNMGYGQIWKDGRYGVVSRFLCEDTRGAPPSPKHHAAHSCGNGHLGCVTKRHLRWATPKENNADKLVHGTAVRGEQSNLSKLTESDVRAIRALRGEMSQKDIAAKFGITYGGVWEIQTRKTWSWLE